jgi:tetratricopeptide (TPR) repeat protein
MREPMPFIGRLEERKAIDACIRETGGRRVIFLHGDGGVGKTRLLQEVQRRYARSARLIVARDIIDLDSRAYYNSQSIVDGVAHHLDPAAFDAHRRARLAVRRMELAGLGHERLAQQAAAAEQAFTDGFNRLAADRRAVILVDTLDTARNPERERVWRDLLPLIARLDNAVWIVAGRDARAMWQASLETLGDAAQLIELAPFQAEDAQNYLQAKQRQMHMTFDADLAANLLILTNGLPILIDLAVEWLARDQPPAWLIEMSADDLRALPPETLTQRRAEFAGKLVGHVTQMRMPADRLVLLLSHVYPLDADQIAYLLELPPEQAQSLLKQAVTYVFVKKLPDGRISLHDVLRDMLVDQVWRRVDPDRRRRYSQMTVDYLTDKAHALERRVQELAEQEDQARLAADAEAEQAALVERENRERELWDLNRQLLFHTLFVDVGRGIAAFAAMFDQATRARRYDIRPKLIELASRHVAQLNRAQCYELRSREIEHRTFVQDYDGACELATALLKQTRGLPSQRVDTLIQRANARIRSGDVRAGIVDFNQAINVSQANALQAGLIKAKNGLGWAHRLLGENERARRYYLEARDACLDADQLEHDYGLILNNLTVVMSYYPKERKNAIDFGKSSIEHWKARNDPVWLGAAYLALGIAYYRSDVLHEALSVFDLALDIFRRYNVQERIGEIYSWRGALYQDQDHLEQAEEDLNQSLKLAPRNMDAMTLNRLGRVQMSRRQWALAEQTMSDALKRAQEIPDYIYWLGTLARMTFIAAEKREPQRLEELHAQVKHFCSRVEETDYNSLGMANIGLARLALQRKDFALAARFLKQGIPLVVEYGSYARTDILSRLAHLEKDFSDLDPAGIRKMGAALMAVFAQKQKQDISYSVVIPRLRKWSAWA